MIIFEYLLFVETIVIIWYISYKKLKAYEILRNAWPIPMETPMFHIIFDNHCSVMLRVQYLLECFPKVLWCSFQWCLPAADGWKVLVFQTCCFQRGRSCTSFPQHYPSLLPLPPLLRFDSMAASSTVDFHCLHLFFLEFPRFPI